MKFLLSALIFLATSAAAIPTPSESVSFVYPTEPINFGGANLWLTPGVEIHASCRETPTIDICPARLPNGNALLTATHVVIQTNPSEKPDGKHVTRVGWSTPINATNPKEREFYEESTLSIFNFPLGMEKKRCRFHFISDAGDASSEGLPSAYSVWSLEAGFDTPIKKSTATNRPKRDEVIAIFDRVNATRSANQKFMHKFIYGPGWYFGAQKNDTSTFPCPSGGELSYEVALVAKTHKLSLWNVGGNEGLGIEIIGLKSNW